MRSAEPQQLRSGGIASMVQFRVSVRRPFLQMDGSPQPFSPMSRAKHSRLREAVAVDSVCPYCAVGCAQLAYIKDGELIDVEGDPRSPINEGTLCPKGANTFQLVHNPHRSARCCIALRTATTGRSARSS